MSRPSFRCVCWFALFVPGSLPVAQAQLPHPAESAFTLPLRPLPAFPIVIQPPTTGRSPHHRFWDRQNSLLFAGIGLMRGLDYASTYNMLRRSREEILLPDDVVNNRAGFAALEAAGAACSIGLSYWMHRTGHHSIERWVSRVHISVAGFGSVRNYALDSKHPALVAP
jgi:hypothetical protein